VNRLSVWSLCQISSLVAAVKRSQSAGSDRMRRDKAHSAVTGSALARLGNPWSRVW